MVTLVTQGIRISVTSEYQELYSRPEQRNYFFSYNIHIENTSDDTVQLLRRHWYIFDSQGVTNEVEGDGVVGQQPVLLPGEFYEYQSACNLGSEIGSMHGYYLFRRESDGMLFRVSIPRFELVASYRKN